VSSKQPHAEAFARSEHRKSKPASIAQQRRNIFAEGRCPDPRERASDGGGGFAAPARVRITRAGKTLKFQIASIGDRMTVQLRRHRLSNTGMTVSAEGSVAACMLRFKYTRTTLSMSRYPSPSRVRRHIKRRNRRR